MVRKWGFDVQFGVQAPARISCSHSPENHLLVNEKNPEAMAFTQCFVLHGENNPMVNEETFAHFRTVSGLHNHVHSSDAEPQITMLVA